MSEEIDKPKDFRTRMMEKLKSSIGDLITEDELKQMIDRSMEEIFFKEREVRRGWNTTETMPPLIHEMVKELMNERMKEMLAQWLKDHPEEVKATLDKVIEAGAGRAVLNAFKYQFESDLVTLQQNILNNLGNR